MNKDKKYYFYLASCSDNTLYSGSCNDLKKREQRHNKGEGAKYTKHRRPVKFVYSEKFKSLSKALKREAEVKKWKREKKESLIMS